MSQEHNRGFSSRGRGRGRGRAIDTRHAGFDVTGSSSDFDLSSCDESQFHDAPTSIEESPKVFEAHNSNKLVGKVQLDRVLNEAPFMVIATFTAPEHVLEDKFEIGFVKTPELTLFETENLVLSEITGGMKMALRNALDALRKAPEEDLEAVLVMNKYKEKQLLFDIFQKSLYERFIEAGVDLMKPQLSENYQVAILTDVEPTGCVSFQPWTEAAAGMVKDLRKYQKTTKIYGPVSSAVGFRYMTEFRDSGIDDFLAPLNGDYSQLQRIKVLQDGRNPVTAEVLYVDIGRKSTIKFEELLVRTALGPVPVMIHRAPPLGKTAKVMHLNTKDANRYLHLLRRDLIGKVCYVKLISEAESQYPNVRILIPHGGNDGVVDLTKFINAFANFATHNIEAVYSRVQVPQIADMKDTELKRIQEEIGSQQSHWEITVNNARLAAGIKRLEVNEEVGADSPTPRWIPFKHKPFVFPSSEYCLELWQGYREEDYLYEGSSDEEYECDDLLF